MGSITKDSALAVALSLILLLSTVTATQFFKAVSADPVVDQYRNPRFQVLSPTQNSIYNTSDVPLTVNVTLFAYYYLESFLSVYVEKLSWLNYSLDGDKNVSMSLTTNATENPSSYFGTIMLSGLTNGRHTLEIYGETSLNVTFNQSLFSFYVDMPPSISILFMQNETYSSSVVPLNFTVNEPFSWLAYSLDGHANVTTYGNTTLSGLSEGSHNVVVYANDTFGSVGASQTVNFTVAVPTVMNPFRTITVAAISGAVVVFLVGIVSLLLYRRHRKTNLTN